MAMGTHLGSGEGVQPQALQGHVLQRGLVPHLEGDEAAPDGAGARATTPHTAWHAAARPFWGIHSLGFKPFERPSLGWRSLTNAKVKHHAMRGGGQQPKPTTHFQPPQG